MILNKLKAAKPDVLSGGLCASRRLGDDHRSDEGNGLNVKMLSSLPYGLLPEYYKRLGKDAEFVYSATFWEAALPNPGNREFVAAYEKEFKRAPAVQSANSTLAARYSWRRYDALERLIPRSFARPCLR